MRYFTTLLLLLAFAQPVFAQSISVIADLAGHSLLGAGNSTTTSTATTATGDLVIVACGYWRNAGASSTPTVLDSKSNSWTEIATHSPVQADSKTLMTVHRSVLTSAGASHSFECNTSSTDIRSVYALVLRSTNGWPSNPEDTGAKATGTSSSPSSGATGTPSQGSTIRVGYFGTDDNLDTQTWTAGTGFTICTNCQQGDWDYYVSALEYKIESSAATTACDATVTSSQKWAAICTVLKDNAPAATTRRRNSILY